VPVIGESGQGRGRLDAAGLPLLVACAVVVGTAFRVWVYRSALGIPDSDEAVVGLMARHILHGQFTTFFWGQAYGGPQEALLTAPLFALFDSSWFLLRLVPIVLSGVAALVTWRAGRRLYGDPGALAAGAVLWVWPPFLLYKLTHQWGFYASGIAYCALIVLLSLRLVERPTRARAALLGLVVGLALWQTEQLAPIVAATAVWLAWKLRRRLTVVWVAVPCAIVGLLPSIVWNLQHDFGSLSSAIADTTTYQHRLRIFASPLLPMLLGLRTPFTQTPIAGSALTNLLYLVLAACFVYGAYRTRRSVASLLFLITASYPFLYAVAPQTLFVQEPRYLVVLSPVLALLLGLVATTVPRAAAVLIVTVAISLVTLHRMEDYFRTVPSDPPAAPRDLTPLVSTLDRLHITRVYATFWTTYRLDFDTRERIIATQSKLRGLRLVNDQAVAAHNPHARWHPYEREVESAPNHGFVILRREVPNYPGVTERLRSLGYRAYDAGPYLVFARLR
jgi:hypothetical protein